MAFDIQSFFSNILASGDYYRPNQYQLEIAPPQDLQISNTDLERICMNCVGASIPGKAIATKEHDQGGHYVRKMPHSVQYSDLVLRFNLSEDLIEKKFFDEWQNMMFDPVWQNLNYYENYATGVFDVTPLSRADKPKDNTYSYIEAWPIDVQQIDIGYDQRDTVAQLIVTIAYKHWEILNNAA